MRRRVPRRVMLPRFRRSGLSHRPGRCASVFSGPMADETQANPAGGSPLRADDVRRVARLARLSPSDEQVERYRHELGAGLELAASLDEVDGSALRPMAAPADADDGTHVRLDSDVPGPMLEPGVVGDLGPVVEDGFFAVPKVLGDGGG